METAGHHAYEFIKGYAHLGNKYRAAVHDLSTLPHYCSPRVERNNVQDTRPGEDEDEEEEEVFTSALGEIVRSEGIRAGLSEETREECSGPRENPTSDSH